MEPRYKVSSIRAIFGNQSIVERFVADLGIQDNSILLDVKYHRMKEMRPNPENFGAVLTVSIGKWLCVMLLSAKNMSWIIHMNQLLYI